ncbi:MAG: ribonuclease E/G, partial [Rhodospirillales bacterium]|nr:ribonuclease E/G [Rhodospirillales bacterium]
TNLEAAEEIARQLRLRDLAGLIVIDFIDMDESRNQRAVERKLKEAMRSDRARIRMGRISPFGLMELSRQRLRPSLVEASMERCESCGGTGVRRSVESSAVHALRAIEEEGLQGRSAEILLRVPAAVGLYIFNRKRRMLEEIEQRYEFAVSFEQDDSLVPPSYAIERIAARTAPVEEAAEEEAGEAAQPEAEAKAEAAEPAKKRRRRRRKPRGEATEAAAAEADAAASEPEPAQAESPAEDQTEQTAAGDGKAEEAPRAKRRRRGRRGGRGRAAKQQEQQETPSESPGEGAAEEASPPPIAAAANEPPALPLEVETPAGSPDPAAESAASPGDGAAEPDDGASGRVPVEADFGPAPVLAPAPPATPEAPADGDGEASADAAEPAEPAAPAIADQGDPAPLDEADEASEEEAGESAPALLPDERRPRRGWWQRLASSSR